jgi:Zn-finger nucleic acid-binding protein
MDLFERRRYFFCRYCGTFHFIDSDETDGVQVLERADSAPCPVCASPLAKALLDNVHAIQYCEQCRGVLLRRPVFSNVVNARRAFPAGAAVIPSPVDHRELQRRIICPQCRGQMDVHPYYGPGNIVIDTCSRCDVLWLDFGELKQVVDAPGKDRGNPRRTQPVVAGAGSLLDLFDDLLP